MTGTKKDEILKHNKKIRTKANKVQTKIDALEQQLEEISAQCVPPCEYCPYDGVYRCETCRENGYDGFNVKDYMSNEY